MQRTAVAALLVLLTALALTTGSLHATAGVGHQAGGLVIGLVVMLELAVLLAAGLAMRMVWALVSAILLGSVWCLAGFVWVVVLGGGEVIAGALSPNGSGPWTLPILLTIPPTMILGLLAPLGLRLWRRLEHRRAADRAGSGSSRMQPAATGASRGRRELRPLTTPVGR